MTKQILSSQEKSKTLKENNLAGQQLMKNEMKSGQKRMKKKRLNMWWMQTLGHGKQKRLHRRRIKENEVNFRPYNRNKF